MGGYKDSQEDSHIITWRCAIKLVVDSGTWSWHICAGIEYGKPRWKETDELIDSGAILCLDSETSIRQVKYPWYKGNRKDLPKVTLDLRRAAHAWCNEAEKRYPKRAPKIDGYEADDLVAVFAQTNDMIVSADKDILQLPEAWLVTSKLDHWGIERQRKYAPKNVVLEQGEKWLVFQCLRGDIADNIPGLLPKHDRKLLPLILSQPSPLRALFDHFSFEAIRERLDVLFIPTPILTGQNGVDVALERFPERS